MSPVQNVEHVVKTPVVTTLVCIVMAVAIVGAAVITFIHH